MKDWNPSEMLTGDKQEVTKEIVEKLGINKIYAELFHKDKLI